MAALAISFLAILALLGRTVPAFDLLNHLQPFLFGAALLAFVFVPPMERRGTMRLFMLATAGVGLVASSLVVVPEALAGLGANAGPRGEHTGIRLMTHNLWGRNYEMERVAQVIASEDPDIIALQEYFPEKKAGLEPLIAARYPYSVQCLGGKRANLGLYSKIPFEQAMDGACSEVAELGRRTARITARFTLADGSSFSVMTTHLDWPMPIDRQLEEFEDLSRAVRQVEGPLVLVGDFNSTPWSFALKRFEDTAGLTRQTRNLMTFPARFYIAGWRDTLPVLPLDHVMTRGGIVTHQLHAAPSTGSDHLPVSYEFSVTPAGAAGQNF